MLSVPPGRSPRSMIWPFFHKTARISGPPMFGSMVELNDQPAIHPRALVDPAALKFTPGNAPRSVMTPSFHRNACAKKQSGKRKQVGSGLAVSPNDPTTPELFSNGMPSPLIGP